MSRWPSVQILRAGLAVAVVDALVGIVTYVLVLKVSTTERSVQGIAASVLGRGSYHDGLPA